MTDLLDDSSFKNKNKVEPANFGSRFLAYVLDYLFIALFIGGLGFVFELIFCNQNEVLPWICFMRKAPWLLYILMFAYALVEGLTGASFGKRLLGIQIRQQNSTAAAISTHLLRAAFKYNYLFLLTIGELANIRLSIGFISLNEVAGVFFIISCLFALSPDCLALHDMVLGTAVYKKRDLDRNN